MDRVPVRVFACDLVALRFKLKSSVYLLGVHLVARKKFPRVPKGLLVGATRKETPRPVTPIISQTPTHARPPGGERPRHRSQQAGGSGERARGGGRGARGAGRGEGGAGSGAELRSGSSGSGAARSRAFSSGSDKVGIHRLGHR